MMTCTGRLHGKKGVEKFEISLEVELRGFTEGLGIDSMHIIRIGQTTMGTEGQTGKKRRKCKEAFSSVTCSSPGKLDLRTSQLAPLMCIVHKGR